jgi:hypothetical protein
MCIRITQLLCVFVLHSCCVYSYYTIIMCICITQLLCIFVYLYYTVIMCTTETRDSVVDRFLSCSVYVGILHNVRLSVPLSFFTCAVKHSVSF